MKTNGKPSPDVYCCCYRYHSRQLINCLGLHGTSGTSVSFDNQIDRKKFMKAHCYPPGEQNRCLFYKILYEQNEDQDDEIQ